jgi:Coenzyme PQQ synthesis protein D (PqqD)
MRFLVDNHNISHERLNDEVIIINLTSAAYYSGVGTASDLWALICQGASTEEAAKLLASTYKCDKETVSRDVSACLASLVKVGIVMAHDTTSASVAKLSLPAADRSEWIAPHFDEYLDMWDLLQFDPVHDVGEAGWPVATSPKA